MLLKVESDDSGSDGRFQRKGKKLFNLTWETKAEKFMQYYMRVYNGSKQGKNYRDTQK